MNSKPNNGPPRDRERLRASLRLVFLGPTADQLATLARDDLTPLIGPALTRYVVSSGVRQLAAAFGRLHRRRATHNDATPEHNVSSGNGLSGDESGSKLPHSIPLRGMPARSAIALALHLGMALDGETLADLFQTTPEQIGVDLDRARRAARPSLPAPCREHVSTVGRVADRSLDVNSRLMLRKHAQTCRACQRAIEASQALDDELRATVDDHQSSLPAGAPAAGRLARLLAAPAALVAGLAVALVLVLIGGNALVGRLIHSQHTPVPLRATVATAPPADGWLLMGGGWDDLVALNLATREQRTLVPPGQPNAFTQFWLSPDRSRIAGWTMEYGPTGQTNSRLTLRGVDGTPLAVRTAGPPAAGTPGRVVGWLNDTELLAVEVPAGEPGLDQEGLTRLMREESRLLAMDLESGTERVLFQGDVSEAVASPDGRLVAIAGAYDPAWIGQTLQIRPVGPDGLGAPVATAEHRYLGGARWAPDSSRLFYTDTVEARAGDRGPASIPRTALVAIDGVGLTTTLHSAPPDQIAYLLAVSPDGRSIVFQQFAPRGPDSIVEVWLLDDAGSRRVASNLRYGMTSATWLPGAESLLLVANEASYLSGPRATDGRLPVTWWVIRQVARDGSNAVVLSTPSGFGGELLGWYPPDTFPPTAPARRSGAQAGAPERVTGIAPDQRLFDQSSASPDGDFVLLMDETLRGSKILKRADGSGGGRHIEQARDLSWVPGAPVVAGVLGGDPGSPTGLPSRIVLYAAEFIVIRGMPGYDFQRLDPGGLGDATDRYYARPLVAPGGGSTAFFVVDDAQRTTTLWLTGWDATPHTVASWPSPDTLAGPQAPLATWVDEHTLVYAEPGGWRDGFAQRVNVKRLAVVNGREGELVELVSLQSRGGEHGIALRELTASPDGAALAYRLRHYTHADPDAGAFDTLSLLLSQDASQPLEIDRGGSGEGLAWSPDGAWLAASVRGRIALFPADGRSQTFATPGGLDAALPVWVSPGELWFAATGGDAGPGILRVRLH